MSETFLYDLFLSYSSKDKAVVRPIAERLRADGLKVWFDEWELKPGDSIPAKIEEGLEHSRVLVLCMSANAFGSDWAQLESGSFRFRDPLNKERRLIPLRLNDALIKGSLAQFHFIDWLSAEREQEYTKLLEACRPPAKAVFVGKPDVLEEKTLKIGDEYCGGKIAWVDATGQHGLIAAEADMVGHTKAQDEGRFKWEDAKKACRKLMSNGYSDWHLPTKRELNKLYLAKNTVGGFLSNFYWSSTEVCPGNARVRCFGAGVQGKLCKNNDFRVRAVRSF